MISCEIRGHSFRLPGKRILSGAVKEAVSAFLVEIILPLEENMALLEAKVAQVDKLEGIMARLSVKANDNEQYSRPQNVRIHGTAKEDGENCTNKIVYFCKNEMAHLLEERNIDKAHRVAKRSGDKSRVIIVRFQSHSNKVILVKCKKSLKGSGYCIKED